MRTASHTHENNLEHTKTLSGRALSQLAIEEHNINELLHPGALQRLLTN